MASGASEWSGEDRSETRDSVHHRVRAAHADGRTLPLVIVNTSAAGLMARCDAGCAPGDRLVIRLPQGGPVAAEVRWALGGRIGCRLERTIQSDDYHTLLTVLRA